MKKVFFIATISLTLIASCKDNKKVGNNEEQKIETALSQEELRQKQDSIEAVREENRILDSIQQVKSHGHAH